jgi:predicted DsbA family dithiol-disulfide isomerase
MRPLLESSDDTPVFTMFHEPLCPHCYKAKRAFEQAAGFFQNFLTFVKVTVVVFPRLRIVCLSLLLL